MGCYCDADAPRVYRESWPTARRNHKCCECGRTIAAGETYQHVSGLWENGFESYKTCERCADLRDSLADVACPAFTDLKNEYREYLSVALSYEQREAIFRRAFMQPNADLDGY